MKKIESERNEAYIVLKTAKQSQKHRRRRKKNYIKSIEVERRLQAVSVVLSFFGDVDISLAFSKKFPSRSLALAAETEKKLFYTSIDRIAAKSWRNESDFSILCSIMFRICRHTPCMFSSIASRTSFSDWLSSLSFRIYTVSILNGLNITTLLQKTQRDMNTKVVKRSKKKKTITREIELNRQQAKRKSEVNSNEMNKKKEQNNKHTQSRSVATMLCSLTPVPVSVKCVLAKREIRMFSVSSDLLFWRASRGTQPLALMQMLMWINRQEIEFQKYDILLNECAAHISEHLARNPIRIREEEVKYRAMFWTFSDFWCAADGDKHSAHNVAGSLVGQMERCWW